MELRTIASGVRLPFSIPDFLRQLSSVDSRSVAQEFMKNWAILTTNPKFWTVSDQLHAYLSLTDPVNAGVLDYTRYGIWTEDGDWHQ